MSLPQPTPNGDDRHAHLLTQPARQPGRPHRWDTVTEDIQYLSRDNLIPPDLPTTRSLPEGSSGGKIPVMPGDPEWSEWADWLTATGNHGYAARQLAATGWEDRCPPWCICDHDRYDIIDAFEVVFHHAYESGDIDGVEGVTVVVDGMTTSEGSQGPLVSVVGRGEPENLDSGQARALAAALLNAADRLDQISR